MPAARCKHGLPPLRAKTSSQSRITQPNQAPGLEPAAAASKAAAPASRIDFGATPAACPRASCRGIRALYCFLALGRPVGGAGEHADAPLLPPLTPPAKVIVWPSPPANEREPLAKPLTRYLPPPEGLFLGVGGISEQPRRQEDGAAQAFWSSRNVGEEIRLDECNAVPAARAIAFMLHRRVHAHALVAARQDAIAQRVKSLLLPLPLAVRGPGCAARAPGGKRALSPHS